jgi:hypothetical protein
MYYSWNFLKSSSTRIRSRKEIMKISSDADDPGFEHGSKNNTTSHQANSGEKAPIYEVRPLDRAAKFPYVPMDALCPTSRGVVADLPIIRNIY